MHSINGNCHIMNDTAVINTRRELFHFLFDHHLTPSDWRGSLIHPLLKKRTDDARIPMNYRGISLINTLVKLYSHTVLH